METVVTIDNFVGQDVCRYLTSLIDLNLNRMLFDEQKGRHIIKFGYDNEFPEADQNDIAVLGDSVHALRSIFNKSQRAVEAVAKTKGLGIASFFLSKHVAGGIVAEHVDSTSSINSHLQYTAMLYLNDSNGTGKIRFPNLDKEISPKAGSLVIFEAGNELFRHSVDEISYDRYSMPMWFTDKKDFMI